MKIKVFLKIIRKTICFLLLVTEYLPLRAEPAGLSIERAMREYQGRYQDMAKRNSIDRPLVWPSYVGCGGRERPAPAFPPDGFYGDLSKDPDLGVRLVRFLAKEFFESPVVIYRNYVRTMDGVQGVDGVPELVYYGVEDMERVAPEEVNEINYPECLAKMIRNINKLRYVVFDCEYVSPDATFSKGTLTASPRGPIYGDGAVFQYADPLGYDFTRFIQEANGLYAIYNSDSPEWNDLYWHYNEQNNTTSPETTVIGRRLVANLFIAVESWGLDPGSVGVPIYDQIFLQGRGKIFADFRDYEDGFVYVTNYDSSDGLWHKFGASSNGGFLSEVIDENHPLYAHPPIVQDLTVERFYDFWTGLAQFAIGRPKIRTAPDKVSLSACQDGSCGAGRIEVFADEGITVNVALGSLSSHQDAGYFHLRASRPTSDLATPAKLQAMTLDGVSVMRDNPDGSLSRVQTPEILATVIPINDFKYELRFAQTSSPTTPYKTITVENPDASTEVYSRLRITESGISPKRYDFEWSAEGWSLISGNGLRRESHALEKDEASRTSTETIEIRNDANTLVSKRVVVRKRFAWGEEIVREVIDPEGANLITTHCYDEDPSHIGSYSRQIAVTFPSGFWERYEYDRSGRLLKTISSFLDAASDASEVSCRVKTLSYSEATPQITDVETLLGQEVSRRYIIFDSGRIRDVQCIVAGASWQDPRNLVTEILHYKGGVFDRELKSIRRPDGVLTTYAYSISSGFKTSTVESGATAGDFVVDGIRTVTVTNVEGHKISERTYDISTGLLLSSSIATDTDPMGRPTRIEFQDGTFVLREYGCCGVKSETDREGVTTLYQRDALKRVIAETRSGITFRTDYDAADRPLKIVREGNDSSQILMEENSYDLAGHLISRKDGLGRTTTYTESVDEEGHLLKTTTFPDGATQMEVFHKDGNLLSVGGTARHPLRMQYGVDANGYFRREIRVGENGSLTEKSSIYRDLAGRDYKILRADDTTLMSFYNTAGQLIRQVDADGVAYLFAYNARGELEYSAIDMDRNGLIDFNGTDRITRIQNSIVADFGTTVHRSVTSVWTNDGSGDSLDVATRSVSVDGLQSWDTQNGLTTRTSISYDGGGVRTETNTRADGTIATSTFQNGRLISSVVQNGSLLLSSKINTYDEHGRLSSSTDALGMTSSLTYDNADQIRSIALSTPGGISQKTSFHYDLAGRCSQTVFSDGGVARYQYFPTGELMNQSGAHIVAAENTYDSQGRLKTLLTRSGLTTWNYDSQRGFLVSKADASGKVTTYTYSPAGRRRTRTWARGIVTDYNYNTAGELVRVNYSDATPDIAYHFDRRGRRVGVASPLDSIAWTYNDAGQILSESHIAGPLAGTALSMNYDDMQRRTGLQFAFGSSAMTQRYHYDGASRILAVGSAEHTVEYGYQANSSRVNRLTFRNGTAERVTATRQYDGLDRCAQVAVTLTADESLNFDYAYNEANQRTRVKLTDGSYWIYGYDAAGQVVSGKKYFADNTPVMGQQFDYTFDDAGNRVNATVNARSAAYTVNHLNQILNRVVPGAVDVLGEAKADARVTVNNQTVLRKNNLFYKEIYFDNANSPVYQPLHVVGVKGDVGPRGEDAVEQESGYVYLSKSPEVFTYDEDGNLTQDGRWNYVWDAENRLLSMTSLASAPVESKRKFEFTYDHQGRRLQKKIYAYDGSQYILSTETKFVYDGWNCIGEMNASGTLIKSYLWGNDLSDSMREAGGIGGLLMVDSAVQGCHFVVSDANGNVIFLVDADTGMKSAVYEYGPFGETLRASGPMAKVNPFRFSTKYQDETGLLYYGYRYLNTSLGRWISRDPSNEQIGGANLYEFCGNDPVNYIDPDGRAYFASRPLGGMPWIPGGSHNPIDDFFNTEISHEQLFFEDATGGNIGFFDDGTLKEELNPSGYRKTRTGLDDAIMREAVKNVPLQPYHLLWQPSCSKEKFNCQDWGEAVRREYERLRKEREKGCK